MKTLYQNDNISDGRCFDLDYFKKQLGGEIDSIILNEQEIDKTAYRYCSLHDGFVAYRGECGKANCGSDYVPVNGKRGKCIYKRFSYKDTGRKFELTKEGLKEIESDS